MTGVAAARSISICNRKIVFIIPFYLQSALVYSVNCVKHVYSGM
jgi:hypothetical protein